jgi:chromosome segregation ATPase
MKPKRSLPGASYFQGENAQMTTEQDYINELAKDYAPPRGMSPICLAAEIERLRAERDDLMKANALLHALIGNREAEIDRLRAALKEIQDNGYRSALCHAVAKTALEQIPMILRELPQKEAAAEIDEAEKNAEIDRLRAALNNLDTCAVPTAEQIEQMEKGIGAIFTPAMALKLGMETAIGNVKRTMAALEEKSP